MTIDQWNEWVECCPSAIVFDLARRQLNLSELAIDHSLIECACGATVETIDEIEQGQCEQCQREDDCPTCGDSGLCAACAR